MLTSMAAQRNTGPRRKNSPAVIRPHDYLRVDSAGGIALWKGVPSDVPGTVDHGNIVSEESHKVNTESESTTAVVLGQSLREESRYFLLTTENAAG